MEKKLPIDDLFREKLADGREITNLGAWANMERMLDGKNPYTDESQETKKRRILPFLGLFLLLGTLLSGFYIFSKKQVSSDSKNQFAQHTPSKTENKAELITSKESISTSNDIINNESANSEINENPLENSQVSNNNLVEPNPKLDVRTNKQNSSPTQANKENLISNSTTEPETTPSNHTNESEIKGDKTLKNVIPKNVTKKSKSLKSKNTQIENSLQESEANMAIANMQEQKFETKFDTVPQVSINENIERARNGQIKTFTYDTVGYSNAIIETKIPVVNLPISEPQVAILTPEQTNPRLVKLTNEEEVNANQKIEKVVAFASINSSKNDAPISNIELPKASAPQLTTKHIKQTSFFQDMVNAAKSNYNKVANSKLNPFSGRITTYPGMNVGMNAALIQSKHNFGGFHFGLTDLIPINDYLNILTEIKMFIRNNSGYTVNDIQRKTIDQVVDQTSLASQNQYIYSYQLDSTNKKYNFNNFTSLELPIMIQRHFGSFSAYGGINLAYNFGLNVKELKNNYPITNIKPDTLSKFDAYTFPTEMNYKYARSDFKSQFGIGYTIGGSYHFNPNIYVDLRLNQTVWNNAKTEAMKEISKGVFKVPSFQFSIGYRFRKYTPGGNN